MIDKDAPYSAMCLNIATQQTCFESHCQPITAQYFIDDHAFWNSIEHQDGFLSPAFIDYFLRKILCEENQMYIFDQE